MPKHTPFKIKDAPHCGGKRSQGFDHLREKCLLLVMQHRRDVEKKTRKTVESHDTTRVHTCHGCEVAAKVPATSFRFNRRTPPTQPRAKARAFAHCREGAIPEEAVHTGTIEATSKPKALCAFPTLGRHRPAFQIRQGLNRQTDREEMLESC